MWKWILLIIIVLVFVGCSLNGAPPPKEVKWSYILSPAGQCYEYANWLNGYTGYTISGQVNLSYCK